MKILFIPCYYDGLPRESGSARIRAEWVCRYWDGAEVYDGSQRLFGYDLYVFQKAYLVGQTQEWIRTASRWRDEGRCRLAFDLCDPDFLEREHRRRMLSVLPLFDFAVASTEPLAEWLGRWLPAYMIPDRVDMAEVREIRDWAVYRRSPRVVWAGYERNVGMLKEMMAVIEELGLELAVLTVERPKPFEEFWQEVAGYDVLLNPRPEGSPWCYKSDNKTLIAWAMGMPVARTGEELRRLCGAMERQQESVQRWCEVLVHWDVRLSVEEWRGVASKWVNG